MGLIELYIIFALTTAIACWYEFYWPVMREAQQLNLNNATTRNPVLSSIVYIIISTVIAPVLIVPFFSTTKSEQFRQGLRKGIFDQD